MSTTAAPTSSAPGVTTWSVDPAHSLVEFAVKHLMISTVKGRFGDVKGAIRYDEASPANSQVDIDIATASIDTRFEQRDAHLRSGDFFDVEHYPLMTFRSRRLEGDLSAEFKLIGDLTIKGNTREVALDAQFEGRNRDPWGQEKMAFEARGKVNRKEFGLNWNQALEAGGWLLGDDIKLFIEVQLIQQKR